MPSDKDYQRELKKNSGNKNYDKKSKKENSGNNQNRDEEGK